MKIVYAGFDGLDVAFQGRLPSSVIEQLRAAKESARELRQPALVEIGPGKVPVHVAQTGSGNYRYLIDTGPDGEKWFFNHGQDTEDWNNIRVSVRAQSLAFYGYEGVKERIWEKLEGFGAWVVGHSVGRIDFAIDFLDKDFVLDPDRFVCRYRNNVETWGAAARAEQVGDDECEIHWTARKCSSIRIGGIRGRQIAVYNKRREVIDRHKSFWWQIWDLDKGDPDNQVWRVEVRLGKDHLAYKWGIKTFEDVDAMIADALLMSLEKIDYKAAHQTDSNVTRQESDAIWNNSREAIAEYLAEKRAGVIDPGAVIKTTRTEAQQRIARQLTGLTATLAVILDIDKDERAERMPQIVLELCERFVRGERPRFDKGCERAEQRYFFLEDRYGEQRSTGGMGADDGRGGGGAHAPESVGLTEGGQGGANLPSRS